MYKIFVSTEANHCEFTTESRDKAMELFTTATRSGRYNYVCVSKVVEHENVLCEWEVNNDA